MTRRKKTTGYSAPPLSAHQAGKISPHSSKPSSAATGSIHYDAEADDTTLAERLTVRETEMLAEIADGRSNQEIGRSKKVARAKPRFRALAQQIKASSAYNQSIGEALGIVGPEQAGPDYATLKPAIKAIINGTKVDVDWNWSGYRNFLSMCELQVDRDDTAGWVLLAIDTTPGYVDTQPFPAKPAKWQYRAIYHAGDSRAGEWSNPVSVTVGG